MEYYDEESGFNESYTFFKNQAEDMSIEELVSALEDVYALGDILDNKDALVDLYVEHMIEEMI